MRSEVCDVVDGVPFCRIPSGEVAASRASSCAACLPTRRGAAVHLFVTAVAVLTVAGLATGARAGAPPVVEVGSKQLWNAALPARGHADPAAKVLLQAFAHDNVTYRWNDFARWKQYMLNFFAEDFTYDFAMPNGTYHGLSQWFHGEYSKWHVSFPKPRWAGDGIIFAGDETQATIVGYGLVDFVADFYGIPAPKRDPPAQLLVVDLDFYIVNAEGRIQWNGCMVDSYGIMVQSGHRLLPAPSLPEGLLYPPRSMAGLPAPMSSYVDPSVTPRSLALVRQSLEADWIEGSQKLEAWSEDLAFFGPWGIGMARGKEQLRGAVLGPLAAAFSNRSFSVDSMLCEGTVCGMYGHLQGLHVAPWLGQAPASTPRAVAMRISLHFNIDEVAWKILDAYCLMDIPGAMTQMGRDLFAELNTSNWAVSRYV